MNRQEPKPESSNNFCGKDGNDEIYEDDDEFWSDDEFDDVVRMNVVLCQSYKSLITSFTSTVWLFSCFNFADIGNSIFEIFLFLYLKKCFCSIWFLFFFFSFSLYVFFWF